MAGECSLTGELAFLLRFVWRAGVRGRSTKLPNAYREVQNGNIENWPSESLEVVIDQGRRQLDTNHALIESSRRRGQYLVGLATAVLGLSALRITDVVDSILTFTIWSAGVFCAFAALLVAYAIVCARAELGSVDTILLSREDGLDTAELKRVVAESYLEQVATSVNTANAWLTVLQDGIRLVVFSAVFVIVSLILAATIRP